MRTLDGGRWFAVFALSLSLTSSSVAQTSNPAPRTGTITGRVLAEDGTVIVGASVFVEPKGVKASGPSRFVYTDAEGNFTINRLAAYSYRLFALAPGYVTLFDPSAQRYYRLGEQVTLTLVKGGVITGRVTDSGGGPVIAAQVRAVPVRDAEGKPLLGTEFRTENVITDDRGIYRIYGLQPGSYLVVTNEPAVEIYRATLYENDRPIYHPSSSRDTAREVTVQAGVEANGIDIYYRSERGYLVSGKVSGALGSANSVGLSLNNVGSGSAVAMTYALRRGSPTAYEFRNIPDGEYEVTAFRTANEDDGAVSSPRRVSVRGGDVTGIDLVLTSLGSIAGRARLEKEDYPGAAKCPAPPSFTFSELLLRARRVEQIKPGITPPASDDVIVDEQGNFAIRELHAARYHLETLLPNEEWYFKTLTLPIAPKPGEKTTTADPAVLKSAELSLKSGEKLAGVTLSLSNGAASLRGIVDGDKENGKILPRLRIHLVPIDPKLADDVLRYSEVQATSDGRFALTHLAPGKYWALARPTEAEEAVEKEAMPSAWDAAARTALRRAAEAAHQEIELLPCQKVVDFKVSTVKPTDTK